MQTVPSEPSCSLTTYERIQRMSSDIRSSPTCFERAAASCRDSGVCQPLRRRITYRSSSGAVGMGLFLRKGCGISTIVRAGKEYTTVRAKLQVVSATDPRPSPTRPARKPRSDGERSRALILQEAARLATVDGISGLSIGRLADAVGMSKSGLFAHFGSKEELQRATVDLAGELFTEHVLRAGDDAPTARDRLVALTEGYL